HFTSGRFLEAHEAFEEVLDDVEQDERWDLLVALIQVAVGYHKAASGHDGATTMLRLGLEKLGAFSDHACGVDVGTLRGRITRDIAEPEARTRLADDPPRITLLRR